MERIFETKYTQLPDGKHSTYKVSKHVDMLKECLKQAHRHVKLSEEGVVPVTIEDLVAAIPGEQVIITIDYPAEIILPEYRQEWLNKLDKWLEKENTTKVNLYFRFKNWIKTIIKKW